MLLFHHAASALCGPVSSRGGHPGLYRAGGRRTLCGCGKADPQGQSVPHGLRPDLRASLRGALPQKHDRQFREYQGLKAHGGGQRQGEYGARSGKGALHGQADRHCGRRAGRSFRGLLSGADGAPCGGVRAEEPAGRHASLRHSQLPLPQGAAG